MRYANMRKMSSTSNRADLEDSLKIRVLFVDDNEAFRHVATEFLQRQHELTVVGATCGGEGALAQARDLHPQVILIGLDRSGLETISRLPSGVDEPVLLLTDIIETMPAEFAPEALG